MGRILMSTVHKNMGDLKGCRRLMSISYDRAEYCTYLFPVKRASLDDANMVFSLLLHRRNSLSKEADPALGTGHVLG